MYPYAIIGNCQISALISNGASIDWYCLPRPDSPPVFGKLLDENGGHFYITCAKLKMTKQRYIENTNVLETIFGDENGNSFSVTDFAPRFEQFGRIYRPTTIIRIVRPIKGTAQINVSCNAVNGWKKDKLNPRRGNSHLQFPGLQDEFRLTTNYPLTYLIDEIPSALDQTFYFALTWGLPVEEDLGAVCESFLQKTIQYWRFWIKHCSIPSSFQQETIRSALALKLHCYEETGAILASITTSLPEEIGGIRNWDYRYCWLRDACFTVSSFYKLGHFEELEGLLRFILNILQRDSSGFLCPVYKIDGSLLSKEEELQNWSGFQASNPVRVSNQAAEHVQNDVYGEILLLLCPLYFDDRFSYLRDSKYENVFENLARKAFESLIEPDAGLWEQRNGWKVHSFTMLMSWAGLDRYATLLEQKKISGNFELIKTWRDAAKEKINNTADQDIIYNSPSELTPDSSLLLLSSLRFPNHNIVKNTVISIHSMLGIPERDNSEPVFLYRYFRQDDFGKPKNAFVICTYWLVEALVKLQEKKRAGEIFKKSLRAANHLGLLSEHFDPASKQQTGNFPQCYSHVGLINAAFAVSADWDEIL